MKHLLLIAILMGGCGGDAPTVPTCTEAMSNFYACGCTFSTEDGAVPLAETITGCNQVMVAASSAGGNCPARMNSLLMCLGDVRGVAECEVCNDELGRLDACK